MALEMFEFPDGSRYELDLSNPAHREWMNKKAGVAPAAQQTAAPQAPGRGMGEEALRQVGLTARAGIKGLASLPGMLVDPITGLANTAFGTKIPTTTSAVDMALTDIGLPKPGNATERVVGDTAGAMAGTGGLIKGAQVAGQGASPLIQALMETLQAGKGTQLASSIGSAGAQGITRESGGGEGAQAAASLAGGMIPAIAGSMVAPVTNLGGKLVDRFTESGRNQTKADLVRGVAGDKKQLVANALTEARPKVQGMTYDAALAAEPAGSTEFTSLARALQKRYAPTALGELEDTNAAARLAEVGKLAGRPGDLEGAKSLRADTANLLYGQAYGKKIAADPDLAVMFKNPFLRQAWEQASDLNAAQGLSTKDNLLKMLQNTKLSLDKMLSLDAKTPLGTSEKREAVNAQKALVSWMEKRSPEYFQARNAFSEQSRPINRMQVGEVLRDKLAAPLDDSERATSFAQAMRDAPRTIKNATGANRFEDVSQVLLPRQVKALEGVQEELARNRSVQVQAQRGEQAAAGAVSKGFATTEPPPFLHRGVTLLRSALEKMQKKSTNRTLAELAQDMQDPARLAQLLKDFPEKERKTIMDSLRQINIAGALGTAVGSSQE